MECDCGKGTLQPLFVHGSGRSFEVNDAATRAVARGSTLSLEMLRSPLPSTHADTAHSVTTGPGLTYSLDRGTVFGQAHGSVQNNDDQLLDPIIREIRSDDILAMGLDLGVRFTDRLSIFGFHLLEDRDFLDRFSSTINIFRLGLVVGF